jgi:hypothetical protein
MVKAKLLEAQFPAMPSTSPDYHVQGGATKNTDDVCVGT